MLKIIDENYDWHFDKLAIGESVTIPPGLFHSARYYARAFSRHSRRKLEWREGNRYQGWIITRIS